MYLPLTLLISLQLHDRKFELPRWSCLVLGLWGVLLAMLGSVQCLFWQRGTWLKSALSLNWNGRVVFIGPVAECC